MPPILSPFFARIPSVLLVFVDRSRANALPTRDVTLRATFLRLETGLVLVVGVLPILLGLASLFADRMAAPIAPLSPDSFSDSMAIFRRFAFLESPAYLSLLGYTISFDHAPVSKFCRTHLG